MRVRAPRQALDVVSRYRTDRRSAAQFEGPQQVSKRLDRYPKRQRGEGRCRHELCGLTHTASGSIRPCESLTRYSPICRSLKAEIRTLRPRKQGSRHPELASKGARTIDRTHFRPRERSSGHLRGGLGRSWTHLARRVAVALLALDADARSGSGRSQSIRRMIAANRGSGNRHLGQLEDDVAPMAHDPGAGLDKLLAQRGRVVSDQCSTSADRAGVRRKLARLG